MEQQSSFIFFKSWYGAIKNLPRAIQGEVLTAIIEYGLFGATTGELKPITKAVLALIEPQIDACREQLAVCAINDDELQADGNCSAEYPEQFGAKKVGAPKGNQNARKSIQKQLKTIKNNSNSIENNSKTIQVVENEILAEDEKNNSKTIKNNSGLIENNSKQLKTIVFDPKSGKIVKPSAPLACACVVDYNLINSSRVNYIKSTNNLLSNQEKELLPEREKERGTKVPPKKEERVDEPPDVKNDIDFTTIVNLYHTICKSYPRVTKLTEKRKTKMRVRLKEMKADTELLTEIFRRMEESKFMQGDNRRGWKADFDWVFENESNWVKILEGKYDNRAVNESNTQARAAPQRRNVTNKFYNDSVDEYPEGL